MSKLIQNFDNPPVNMFSAPFWAWNAKLKDKTLRNQIQIMKKMGFTGFFMHSRTGLDTPYLEEEWFQAIDTCIDEAEKLGMLAYLYDEDRWPSGAAGGIVTKDDRFKARKLYCSKDNTPKDGVLLVSFALILENDKIVSMRKLNPNDKLNKEEQKFNFYCRLMENSTWYNNATYLDTMNKDAVARFIEVTHEQYAKHYQEKFSKSVPAMFTDEPCYIHGEVNGCLPWTDSICDEFQKRYNYNLLDKIPELFFATNYEVSLVRHDFYELTASLFAENFCGQIANWGYLHNLPLCGHLLGEDALSSQTLYIGSAMRCYEKMQIPGVDVLTEHWNIFNTVKQMASVARQQGKNLRMTETYGCTGWDFPLFGHKAIGDWQYALGVNMRCLHLTWYSITGEGKRDYPASFSNHSPWFEKYPLVEKYFARLGAVSLCTEEIRDILVIHPIESLWSTLVKDIPKDEQNVSNRTIQPGRKVLDYFDSPIVNQLDNNHTNLTNLLLKENLDFDFGDEEIMSRLTSIEGETLKIGQAKYLQVLIPELKTIKRSTLELLGKFKGKIFYLGEIPQFVDAKLSDDAKKFYSKFTHVTMENVAEKISQNFRRISIVTPDNKEAKAVFYRLGKSDDSYSLFVVNTSMIPDEKMKNAPKVRDRNIVYENLKITLNLPLAGDIFELDLVTEKKYAVEYSYTDNKYILNLSLGVLESKLFVITNKENLLCDKKEEIKKNNIVEKLDIENFDYTLSEPNILVLDHAAFETPFASSDAEEYIISLDDKLRAAIGEAPRGGKMEQPWHRKDNTDLPSMPLKLFYTFSCDEIPQAPCVLTMENPEKFTIKLNDVELQQNNCSSFYLDEALKDISFNPNLLKKGLNQLSLECQNFDRKTELEAIFIRGNFGVNTNNSISKLPDKLTIGNWCDQGLLNYAGNVTIHFSIDNPAPSVLNFNDWRGTLLGIKINDGQEILLAWQPFEVVLPKGNLKLSITVYGHRRNAFGPFYLNEKWPERTGPHQFKVYESEIRQLVPFGLLEHLTIQNILN